MTYSLGNLTDEEIEHLHECLTMVKNDFTRDGRPWHKHTMNAQLRTRLENLR